MLNRKKVKLSYRCLPNFKSAISKHNFKILNQKTETTPLGVTAAIPRTAPSQESAPQKVLYTELLWPQTVQQKNMWDSRQTDLKIDTASTSRTKKTPKTEQILHLLDKDKKIDFEIKWEIVCKAAPFSPTSKTCNLCLAEKWNIMFKSESASLNKRQEIFNHCRHKEKQLLVKKVRRLRTNGTWDQMIPWD